MNKKFIVLVIVSLLTISQQLWAVSYRGFVEIGTGVVFPNNSINNRTRMAIPITTTHGLQILNQVFVGVGVGVDLGVNYPDYNFKGYDFSDMDVDAWKKVRVFGDIRWDGFGLFGKGKRVSPFVNLKLGWQTNVNEMYSWKWHTSIDHFSTNGFFLEPQAGIRIGCSSKVGINIGLYIDAINFIKIGTIEVDNVKINAGNLNLPSLGLMVGVDF